MSIFEKIRSYFESAQKVLVIDEAGQPLSGVKIRSVSMSATSEPNFTDAKGIAIVPDFDGTKWLTFELAGYTKEQVNFPDKATFRITLIKNL
jgi:hypothetical protein